MCNKNRSGSPLKQITRNAYVCRDLPKKDHPANKDHLSSISSWFNVQCHLAYFPAKTTSPYSPLFSASSGDSVYSRTSDINLSLQHSIWQYSWWWWHDMNIIWNIIKNITLGEWEPCYLHCGRYSNANRRLVLHQCNGILSGWLENTTRPVE